MNCFNQCVVLWNTVWILYEKSQTQQKRGEIQRNGNMKDIKTFPNKEDDCKDNLRGKEKSGKTITAIKARDVVAYRKEKKELDLPSLTI